MDFNIVKPEPLPSSKAPVSLKPYANELLERLQKEIAEGIEQDYANMIWNGNLTVQCHNDYIYVNSEIDQDL